MAGISTDFVEVMDEIARAMDPATTSRTRVEEHNEQSLADVESAGPAAQESFFDYFEAAATEGRPIRLRRRANRVAVGT